MDTNINESECSHLEIKYGDLGRYVILLDNPRCIQKIVPFLDGPRQIVHNRKYNIYTGKLNGQKASVCSTVRGGSAAAIATRELIAGGVNTIIRVGVCIGINPLVSEGHLVIAEAAIRAEDTSYEYLPYGCPAIANYTVTSALVQAAKELSPHELGEEEYLIGVVRSKNNFYSGVTPNGLALRENTKKPRKCDFKYGCLASETACAAIYAVGLFHSVFPQEVRCGGVLTALRDSQLSRYPDWQDTLAADTSRRTKCAVHAMKIIIEQDRLAYNRMMDKIHGIR